MPLVFNRACMLSLGVSYRIMPFTYNVDAPTTLLLENLAFKVPDAAYLHIYSLKEHCSLDKVRIHEL